MPSKEGKRQIVVSRLIGGLGNQMFQYAVGRAISLRTGGNLVLDISAFDSDDLRRYELEGYLINAEVSPRDIDYLANTQNKSRGSFFGRIFPRYFGKETVKVFKENSFAYDGRVETLLAPVVLEGYWQSWRYFKDFDRELRVDFSLSVQPDSNNLAVMEQIASVGKSAVSLHIRRGDYVTNAHTAKYHGLCSPDYYRSAIDYIAKRVSTPHFFIFSDDHGWVKSEFDIAYPMTLVQANGPDQGIYDMALMKSCAHHIIANSSFSWWGAWLNPSPEKIVVAPNRWFSDEATDTRDLIPSDWIRL
ncbi:MAG: glycosyl transferase family 11 [Proteobacteria bacterium]|nr:glycosyl transferase family 11 [Pseudomonadota bacterium]